MIAKIIPMYRATVARKKARLQTSVFGLTRYIIDADPYLLMQDRGDDILSIVDYALAVRDLVIVPGEKVEQFGSRNLLDSSLASWQTQMLAVARHATRIRSPMLHIVISLHEGERWTEAQREETLNIILDTLELSRCQMVWVEHSDANNRHIHMSIIRVDPMTLKQAGSDWLIDDLHQAVALIEEKHGRISEPNALYEARYGVVYDRQSGIMVRDVSGNFVEGWYKNIGQKRDRLPAEYRHLRADLITAREAARAWQEFHNAIAGAGLVYDKAGSGARIQFQGKWFIEQSGHGMFSGWRYGFPKPFTIGGRQRAEEVAMKKSKIGRCSDARPHPVARFAAKNRSGIIRSMVGQKLPRGYPWRTVWIDARLASLKLIAICHRARLDWIYILRCGKPKAAIIHPIYYLNLNGRVIATPSAWTPKGRARLED